ncbi:Small ubiquitin-related modifier [Forsythia ovata]|uniref:Small ubiquitin-related modifier n=1 Tax=Forsythia ovata TaxID=205694 RepID=A0ABD1UTJ0_9LAMI
MAKFHLFIAVKRNFRLNLGTSDTNQKWLHIRRLQRTTFHMAGATLPLNISLKEFPRFHGKVPSYSLAIENFRLKLGTSNMNLKWLHIRKLQRTPFHTAKETLLLNVSWKKKEIDRPIIKFERGRKKLEKIKVKRLNGMKKSAGHGVSAHHHSHGSGNTATQYQFSAFNAIAFPFDGRRLRPKQTSNGLEMEDGDEIDAMLHQTEGTVNSLKLRKSSQKSLKEFSRLQGQVPSFHHWQDKLQVETRHDEDNIERLIEHSNINGRLHALDEIKTKINFTKPKKNLAPAPIPKVVHTKISLKGKSPAPVKGVVIREPSPNSGRPIGEQVLGKGKRRSWSLHPR